MNRRPWPSDTWFPVSIAPTDQALELCVIEGAETCVLVFPCQKVGRNWVDCESRQVVDIEPTHWRPWAGQGETDR